MQSLVINMHPSFWKLIPLLMKEISQQKKKMYDDESEDASSSKRQCVI